MARSAPQSVVPSGALIGGVVGGLVHTAVAGVLWQTWFDSLLGLLTTKPLTGAYILLGMFLLGFVPTLLYAAAEVTAPAVTVSALLLLSGVGSVMAGTVRPPSAVPTPFGVYILLWVGIVALAGVIGGVEYRYKQRVVG